MRARAVASPHRGANPDERNGEIPLVAMDLAYVGQKESDKLMPLIVVKEDSLGEIVVHGLLSKLVKGGQVNAGQGAYLVKCVLNDIESLGYKRMIMKSDQEAVLKALRAKVKQLYAG